MIYVSRLDWGESSSVRDGSASACARTTAAFRLGYITPLYRHTEYCNVWIEWDGRCQGMVSVKPVKIYGPIWDLLVVNRRVLMSQIGCTQ